MSKEATVRSAMKLALDAFSVIEISDNLDWIRHQAEQQAAALREALAEQPAPVAKPHEQEPFGFAVMENPITPPAQRKPLTLWTEAQHERAYRNSPELHKDVKSLAAFKRVAKEIAAMYGIKENT